MLIQKQTLLWSTTMPTNNPIKDIFFVSEMYLEKANYSLCLGEDIYVGCFQERILCGPIQYDEKSGKAKFSPKATIAIPSS